MPQEVTRRRFMSQTLGVIGGATVSGDLLPLLAEAAKRKQVLRVAIERDFETLRPELSAGDTANLLRRLIYTTPIIWGTTTTCRMARSSTILDSIETVLATAYKVSEDRQLIEFTLRPRPNLPMAIPSTPRPSRSRMPGSWAPRAPDSSRSMACPVPIASRWSMT